MALSRTPIPLTPEDQRKSRRPRVLLAGRLIYGEAAMTIDCTIRDRTESGARLSAIQGLRGWTATSEAIR